MSFAFQPRAEQVSSEEQLTCSACKIAILPNMRHSHYRSDWHRYNLKRKCVDMAPIDQAVFEAKLATIIHGGQAVQSVSSKKKKKDYNKTIQSNYDCLIGSEQWQLHQLASTMNAIGGVGNSGTKNSSSGDATSLQLLTYQCTLCHKTFKTHQQCLAHLHTKKHRTEFSKYHRNLRSLQQDEIDVFRATNDDPEEAACVASVVEYELNANANANANANESDGKNNTNKKMALMTCVENNPFITVKQATFSPKKLRGVHAYDEEKEPASVSAAVPVAVAAEEDIAGEAVDEHVEETNGDADADADPEADQRVAIDPTRRCLFCTHSVSESNGLSNGLACLQHMCDEHGFFIPFPKRVANVSQLLRMAGDIIGMHRQCVWCWKIFKSVRGCQAHMRHTTHCKLQLDFSSNITYCSHAQRVGVNTAVLNEDDASPFAAFIDFGKLVQDDEDGDDAEEAVGVRDMMIAAASSKRRIVDVTDCAELVRDDGTRIGHRDRQLAYRQKHGQLASYQESQTEEQIIAQINNPQRKLKLMQMEREKQVQAFEESGAKLQTKYDKVKEKHVMSAQTRQYKLKFQNWVNLQKSKQLYT